MLLLKCVLTAPSIDTINTILIQCNQPKLIANLSESPIKQWLTQTNTFEAKDCIIVTVHAVGLPSHLETLSLILDRPGIDLSGVRIYVVPLSYLEDRIERFSRDPSSKFVSNQLSNVLRY